MPVVVAVTEGAGLSGVPVHSGGKVDTMVGVHVAAASADDLVAVYRDIARLVPCPAERYWGQR